MCSWTHATLFAVSYQWKGITVLQEVAETSGVGGQKDVLPIKNFCNESEPTTEAGILVYRALQEARCS